MRCFILILTNLILTKYLYPRKAISCATKAIPCVLQAAGMYDVEFRIIIACREGSICLLRRGWLEGKVLIQTTANIIDIVVIPGDHFIMTATTDRMLQCYTKRVTYNGFEWYLIITRSFYAG